MLRTDAQPPSPDLATLRAENVTILDEPSAKAFLRTAGLEVPSGVVAATPVAAADVSGVDLPCMVKLVAPDLPHKSDLGGVAGPLHAWHDVEAAARRMLESAPAGARGVLVEPWVPGAAELIMSLSVSTPFGPILLFGLGGIWVEEYHDISYRLAPVTEPEAREMIRSRRAARLLEGARGTSPIAIDELAAAMSRFSELALRRDVRDHIAEIEINPLILGADGTPTAVDCTVTLRHSR